MHKSLTVCSLVILCLCSLFIPAKAESYNEGDIICRNEEGPSGVVRKCYKVVANPRYQSTTPSRNYSYPSESYRRDYGITSGELRAQRDELKRQYQLEADIAALERKRAEQERRRKQEELRKDSSSYYDSLGKMGAGLQMLDKARRTFGGF